MYGLWYRRIFLMIVVLGMTATTGTAWGLEKAPDFTDPTWRIEQIRRTAAFIYSTQDEHGAMNESGYINTDSNMLYAVMGLIAAYDLTHEKEYLHRSERAMRWLMSVQNPDGDWYLSYKREGDRYVATLPKSYRHFKAIRGVDTTMALFIHATALLDERSKDESLKRGLRDSARRAYQFLTAHNLDPSDGLYWSSYQLLAKPHADPNDLSGYRRYRVKYATDNAETYLGLIAYAKLFQDQAARQHAFRLKTQFTKFIDEQAGTYAVMLDRHDRTKMQPSYARHFATGWSAYLFDDPSMFTRAQTMLAIQVDEDGSFTEEDGTYALSTLSFLLGESKRTIRFAQVDPAQKFLTTMLTPSGGVADDVKSRNTYVNIAGMCLLYLCEEAKRDQLRG
ncbi:hypothetical protein [Brevibacillus dissolubilis]|uniref:hypothetical protein n=1 Tax=Brevibacillus dissolubilis TaxID=1844116 RepID=UPI001116DD93|nr:hypothetical protein [Brevibacillus dissolubilis]